MGLRRLGGDSGGSAVKRNGASCGENAFLWSNNPCAAFPTFRHYLQNRICGASQSISNSRYALLERGGNDAGVFQWKEVPCGAKASQALPDLPGGAGRNYGALSAGSGARQKGQSFRSHGLPAQLRAADPHGGPDACPGGRGMSGTSEQVPTASRPSLFPWELLFELAEYRSPMPISEYILYDNYLESSIFYLCPRCDISLEREFQSCCDRCGQRLDWKHYLKAKRRPSQHD